MTSPILGVVLAGGQSSRFGSDKALAELGGRSLILQAVETLSGWCDHVVIVGRAEGPAPCLPDWPRPGMGPLAGLAAALHFALDEGYGEVLSLGVDSPGLPDNLPDLLGPAPVCLAQQPVIGLWPAKAGARAVESILHGTGRHSMLALAEALGARRVTLAEAPRNINRPEDLTSKDR
jgi:molybdopterin-guanine dinucleotide biosynthesis protein A